MLAVARSPAREGVPPMPSALCFPRPGGLSGGAGALAIGAKTGGFGFPLDAFYVFTFDISMHCLP